MDNNRIYCSIFLLAVYVVSFPFYSPAQSTHAVIQQMVDSITVQHLSVHIDQLQKAGGTWNRVTYTPGNDSAVQYVYRQFLNMPGLSSVSLDTFYNPFAESPYNTKPLVNVIATIEGVEYPATHIVIGGHIDCSASRMGDHIWYPQWNKLRAPGADDNASGVAAVIELARIMSDPSFDYDCKNTIIFAAFGAEERGVVYNTSLNGSTRYADRAVASKENIAAMLSLDMIGFNDKNNMYLNIVANTQSQWLGKYIAAVNDSFALGLTLNPPPFAFGEWSDHAPFWNKGYPAVCLIEFSPPWLSNSLYNANPFYHTTADTLETLNMELVKHSAQLSLAAIASLQISEIPAAVVGKAPQQSPDGYSLSQNFPNPFNAGTRIPYGVGAEEWITIKIFSIIGTEIATLVDEPKNAGRYSVDFPSHELPSGLYLCRMISGKFQETRKLLLMK